MKLKKVIPILSLTLFACGTQAENVMSCPAIKDITQQNGLYTAVVPQGKWMAELKNGGKITAFTQALYMPEKGLERGVLVNCSYEVANGDIDMTFYKTGNEGQEENLNVSIAKHPNWKKEEGAVGAQFYECTDSPAGCQFTVLDQ